VLAEQEGVLQELCAALGLPWDGALVFWAPGEGEADGHWAPHWIGAVEKSRGFGPSETGPVDLPEDARRLADRCRPFYEQLAIHRIKVPAA
jgi:hypothetical protein